MASLTKLPKIHGKAKLLPKFRARGRFYSAQALLDAINEMASRGSSLFEIASECGVNYRTVRKALLLRPDNNSTSRLSPTVDERYVIVSETGISDLDASRLYPEMDQPWIQGAALAESTPLRIRRRMDAMGIQFGWIRVAKLVYVDPITLKEPKKPCTDR